MKISFQLIVYHRLIDVYSLRENGILRRGSQRPAFAWGYGGLRFSGALGMICYRAPDEKDLIWVQYSLLGPHVRARSLAATYEFDRPFRGVAELINPLWDRLRGPHNCGEHSGRLGGCLGIA